MRHRSWVLPITLVLGFSLAQSADAQCLSARGAYDFTPAPHVLYETDFSTDPIGRFPKSLEFKTGALMVAEWQGRPALKASDRSAFAIPLTDVLPAQFTLEVTVVHRNTKQVGAYTVEVYGGRGFDPTGKANTRVAFAPDGWWITGGGTNAEAQLSEDYDGCVGQQSTMRIAVDNTELTLYGDERQLAHVPNAKFLRSRGVVIQLEGRDDSENAVYVTSIRLSGAQPPTVVAQSSAATVAEPERSATVRSPAGQSAQPARPMTTAPVAATTSRSPQAAASSSARTIAGDSLVSAGPTAVASGLAAPTAATSARAANAPVARVSATPVTGLTAYAGFGNNQLTWRPAPGAAGYSVHRRAVNATEAHVVTGVVTAEGGGLLSDTIFVDRSAVANQQYVYYVFAYFRDPNDGEYYFPPAQFQVPAVVVTTRDMSGKPWLPPDWKNPPTILAAKMVPGDTSQTGAFVKGVWKPFQMNTDTAHIDLSPRPGSLGWAVFVDVNALPLDGFLTGSKFDCNPTRLAKGFSPYHPALHNTNSIRRTFSYRPGKAPPHPHTGEREFDENTGICYAIFAIYPDAIGVNGTPALGNPHISGEHWRYGVDAVVSDPVYVMFRYDDGVWSRVPESARYVYPEKK